MANGWEEMMYILADSDATCLKMGQEIYFLECRDLIPGFLGLQGHALGMSSGL